jgi:hypothetical protein
LDVATIVAECEKLGVSLLSDGGNLRVRPWTSVPPQLQRTLREHKDRVLSHLEAVAVTLAEEVSSLLGWASALAESGLLLGEPVRFTEAPLRSITTERVSYYAAGYLRVITRARLQQRTGGTGRFLPPWWREREQDALYALGQLKLAMETRQ